MQVSTIENKMNASCRNRWFSATLIAFSLLMCCDIPVLAQTKEKISIFLNNAIEKAAPSELVHLIVKGDPLSIREGVVLYGGIYKFGYRDICAIAIPAARIREFSGEVYVHRLEYNVGKGSVLNDEMVFQNNVDSVHLGLGNLSQVYDGEGVVIGMIDTGIDFTHPDFQDSTGQTRIKYIWDQTQAFDPIRTPQPYNYGQEWNAVDIDGGICTHDDQPGYYGHGSSVSGVAAGNGLAINNFKGVAPKADIIMVASNLSSGSWMSSIADAVDFIFNRADSLGKPCVINASVGNYMGSHDGRDLTAQLIDAMILSKPGRVMVAAAGNAGNQKFHLGYDVTPDSSFTWFQYNPNSALGYGSVYFELWADTADFNNVAFSVGADQIAPSYSFRGGTPYDFIYNRLSQTVTDTIFSVNGDTIAIVDTWAELIGDRYYMEVHLQQPDSNQYYYRFSTKGIGKFDVWSAGFLGISNMVSSSLPSVSTFPDIARYKLPDTDKTIVSSWTCSPNIITVGNYVNKNIYIDYNGNTQNMGLVPGNIAANSSKGPTRTGYQKPEIAATGDIIFSCSRLASVAAMIPTEPHKVAPGGMHNRGGGTSLASPVVAGIAALYLQKCPGASHTEVIAAITSTAKADGFTGTVPNNIYGYGKANALAALESSNLNFTVSNSGSNSICQGDSIVLSAPSGLFSYLWNTGDTIQSIIVNQAGNYSVAVKDFSGCASVSQVLNIIVNPNPNQPVITQSGDTLISDAGATYQWYFNGSSISGANNQNYIVSQDGDYFIVITDNNGCTAISDTLNVINSSTVKLDNDGKVSFYPNPFNGTVNVEIFSDKKGKHTLIITDILGQAIFHQELDKSGETLKFVVDLKDKPKGVYFLRLENEVQVITKKMIQN